jgi:hypothetical protein
MEAIDFKKLLREERKRSRKNREVANVDDVTSVIPAGESRTIQSPMNSFSPISPNDKSPRNGSDPEFIAYILRASNLNYPVVDNTGTLHGENSIIRKRKQPSWSHAPGFLSMSKLNLTSICENPASIFYSRSALANDGAESDMPSIVNAAGALEDWLHRLPHGESGLCEWKTMNFGKRRVCMFGEGEGDCDGSLPPPLREIAEELVSSGVFPPVTPPNHVLLNEYQPGQGILPHTDGPLYESRTATLSLSSNVVIEFSKRLSTSEIGSSTGTSTLELVGNDATDSDTCQSTGGNFMQSSPLQVFLEAGSLLLFQDDAYLRYCHGIAMDVWNDETTERCLNAPPHQIVQRGKRYSLTFRHKKGKSIRGGRDGALL